MIGGGIAGEQGARKCQARVVELASGRGGEDTRMIARGGGTAGAQEARKCPVRAVELASVRGRITAESCQACASTAHATSDRAARANPALWCCGMPGWLGSVSWPKREALSSLP